MGVVELQDVSFTYSTAESPAVTNITLALEAGELCALVGPNGAGKTTICNIIRGFIPKFHTGELEGTVHILGEDSAHADLGLLGQSIGFVFQNPFVQISGAKDTVFEEVAFGLENLGVEVAEIHRRVDEAIALTNIEHLREKNPFELSGGQKQRVAFASTLAMDPSIYVIDEPTSQLDPQGTEEIFEIIRMLKQRGKTIILVEHKMELVAEYADRVIVLGDGQIVLSGTPSEVFASPELAKHHVAAPQYATAGLALRDAGVEVSRVPVTRAQALDYFGQRTPSQEGSQA